MALDNTSAVQAETIEAALRDAYPDLPDNPAIVLTAALGDLRHYADAHRLSYQQCDGNAYGVYLQEKST
ncbi:hypothetical protein PhaeoP23_03954 (plasmid) [Phaeobacter piscinae]|uniref:Uncharacterized protein n=1 Tax=Phaeobacter piscinae TaxID=1580596 RepID=A0ABM6PKB2_9RHOB|nr:MULTISPECIES: hypothetical protein [Phaeobacter]ATG38107.1 hypothetical protein PhaeoP36_04032 [Phaeobacter piscinae]AUQ88628.1 hypothetical protein PhaeoP42_04033 [Phaeobacter piscinae]AUQ92627.1 hypothetical protein PhaeoP24_04069 [Phaeobacter inhibens]AUR26433.1 hypothetical protein PhaeoP23_03954 [Phaeobacter piscinae]